MPIHDVLPIHDVVDCETLRLLAHSNFFRVNRAALRTLSKLENMSPSAQGTQIPVRFVCVYVLSTLSFITVSNRVSRCLNHCFRSFRSLFESISIDYKLMELNYFIFETFHLRTLLGSLILYVCTRA